MKQAVRYVIFSFYNLIMKIKIIEKGHELDLEDALNEFIQKENPDIQDMQYQVALTSCHGQLEYSFSCLIVYSSQRQA